MSRTGASQWAPARMGGSSTWRGLSMGMTATATVADATDSAIGYDVLFVDTDEIRSTGTIGPYGGSVTIPAGAAGVVPTGMGGLWRLTAQTDVYLDSDVSGGGEFISFGIVINDFVQFWEDDLAGTVANPPIDVNLTVASFVYPLEEGDVVWCRFLNQSGDNTYAGGPDATFLMEYLGPLPEPPPT